MAPLSNHVLFRVRVRVRVGVSAIVSIRPLASDTCSEQNAHCTVEQKEHQNADVVQALKFMTAGLPVMVSLLSLLAMQWYHINEVRAAAAVCGGVKCFACPVSLRCGC